jgi:hypothetical protein
VPSRSCSRSSRRPSSELLSRDQYGTPARARSSRSRWARGELAGPTMRNAAMEGSRDLSQAARNSVIAGYRPCSSGYHGAYR